MECSPNKVPSLKCQNKQVVGAESAILNLPNETAIMINGNHRTICRFSNTKEDAIRYRPVWSSLKTMVDKLLSTEDKHVSSKLRWKRIVVCVINDYVSRVIGARGKKMYETVLSF